MEKLLEYIGIDINLPIADPTWIFFLVLAIILFAPIVFEKLRIPHIIGMILAGVLVGEHGFNILVRDSSFELFGQVGLYYIMFLAGLEMNMEDFKNIRVKATVLGLLAFIIPMAIGIWTNLHLLNYGLITSILLASMYASHTLVAYPIAQRYGVTRQRSVGIAVGGTAVTDTLTLLVLAIISGLYKGDVSDMFWVWMLVKVVILGAIIMYTFPRIGRWFFRRYSDGVVQFIFVLAMVFLGAGLMAFVGMEGILGAFLVGLVLNRLIPQVSPLMNHLEFVGNALFIPYFLIGVGMLINVEVLFGHIDSIKVALVMIVAALVGKWIASWLTQKLFRMSSLEGSMMYGMSTAQAAATLAAVMVGYNIIMPSGERLLNEDVLNGTILLILVTCIVSSFITEHAAKRMAIDEATAAADDKSQQQQERFLIPVANPSTIDTLMSLALVVRNQKVRDNLVALSVINDNNDTVKLELQARRNLERAAQIAASAGVELKTVSRFDLNITTGIRHTAKENNATAIIIGLHYKASIVDSFFGNMTENLLKNTYLQVMVVRLLMPVNTLRRIVVAIPPKAEFEQGFVKWVTHICRISAQLGCRVFFYGQEQTLGYIRGVMAKKKLTTRARFFKMDSWDDLLMLSNSVNYDHLFVIVSARRGFISYDNSFEKLPAQISKYFNNSSIMVLYPEQKGDPIESLSFSNPHGIAEPKFYDKLSSWLKKVGMKFKKPKPEQETTQTNTDPS